MSKGRVCVILAGVFLVAGDLPAARNEDGPRLADMEQRLLELPADAIGPGGPAGLPAGPGDLEELLLQAGDGKPYPIQCLTPLSAGAVRPDAAGTALSLLAVPPALRSSETTRIDNLLSIRYTTDLSSPHAIDAWDGNGNGLPDLVDRIAWGATGYRELAVERFGFVLPRVEVVLARLTEPATGLAVPPAASGPDGSFVVVDPDTLSESNGWGAVAHQLAHASLFTYSTTAPAWWHEATAVWLEKAVTNDLNSHAGSARIR